MNPKWHLANSNWAVPLAERRDDRIVGKVPAEIGKLTSLLVWTHKRFNAVAQIGVEVATLVQMTGTKHGPERALVCGARGGRSFLRKDGVRCHFQIVVREVDGMLELISYVFHVDAPEAEHQAVPQFLRWEYSSTRKSGVDAVKEPLAHLHPGHDDIRLPSPVLSPKELITVFLSLRLWE